MGWVWRDDGDGDDNDNDFNMPDFENPIPKCSSDSGEHCSTRRIVQSKCNTEEVEPGKFVRKCEKTEQILKDCFGKPTEIVQSNEEYTEEDVTDEMKKGSSIVSSDMMRPFEFPGLRSDIENMERSFFGGLSRFFEAAEAMTNEFNRLIDDPSLFGGASSSSSSSSSSRRQEIPVEGRVLKEPKKIPNDSEFGNVDITGLARDV